MFFKIKNKSPKEKKPPVSPESAQLSSWQILNSPFVIWLLTVLVLTIGGAILNEQKSCRLEAEQLIDHHRKLAREVFSRRRAIYDAILSADSIGDLKSISAKKIMQNANIYSEFKERTLEDLQSEFDYVELKTYGKPVGITIHTDELSATLDKSFERIKLEDKLNKRIKPSEFEFDLGKADFSKAQPKDFPEIQRLAWNHFLEVNKATQGKEFGKAQCGYRAVILRMLFGLSIPVVKFVPPLEGIK